MTAATALVVGRSQHHEELREALRDVAIDLLFAGDCDEARRLLKGHPEVRVVFSDLTLPDGNWWCIHKELQRRATRTELIVVLPHRGNDAREILAHGTLAVVAPPFRKAEIEPLIQAAVLGPAHAVDPAWDEAECMLV